MIMIVLWLTLISWLRVNKTAKALQKCFSKSGKLIHGMAGKTEV